MTDSPKSFSVKASKLALKCIELLVGDNASPASPIAPDLASGTILKNGIAESTVLGTQSPLLSTLHPFSGSNTN